MVTFTEGKPNAGHIVSEAGGETGGKRSREKVTLLAGTVYLPGMVLGKVTASGKHTQLDPAGADGSEAAASVCWGNYDASAADVDGVVNVRETEVNASSLIWPDGISQANKDAAIAALEANGVIAR